MSTIQTVFVPDIGGAHDVEVIELLVAPGDTIAVDASLITLESDKASMEIPSPLAGVIKSLQVKVGDKVSQGSAILTIETAAASSEVSAGAPISSEPAPLAATPSAVAPVVESSVETQPTLAADSVTVEDTATDVHAGPGVRRLARECGIDLSRIPPTGPKNRILKEDIQGFIKAQLSKAERASSAGGLSLPSAPVIDFSQFGAVEFKSLSKIKKLSGANLHRSWVTVPHVTQFAQADITEMEAFREQQKSMAEKRGVKLTPLVFIMKAVVAALKAFPHFNASLDASGEQLILKKYYNLGVAVDTPNGLVVPVVRHVDQKSLLELAEELAKLSSKARDKGLSLTDMQGSCFTISSLGGIGGTAFTPIVNAPDVAILGVSKASIQPVYQNGAFVPRLQLPLSLSYDHRVIDGAEGARFIVYLTERLSDIRTLLL